jgi:YARHG domain
MWDDAIEVTLPPNHKGDANMQRSSIVIGVALATAVAGFANTAAQAQDACQRLWVARNSIYKAAGYCFKTQRAIGYFGNGGCLYDREGDLPLSPGDQARISEIQAQERAYGCR